MIIYKKAAKKTKGAPLVEWKVSRGDVEFKSVYFRYQPSSSDFVLKNVDFKVDAGTKVGIVGRTGSGKSSKFTSRHVSDAPTMTPAAKKK